MTEVIVEIKGLGEPTVRACLAALGGRDRTPRRMAGRGWTAVVLSDPLRMGHRRVERVILHLLGAPGPVGHVLAALHALVEDG